MIVLVIGATGTIGREVTARLLERGATVRALVRSSERAAHLPAGAEPVIGDLRDAASVQGALTGVTAAFYVSPHDRDEERMAENVVSACERLGVRLCFAGVALTSRSRVLHPGGVNRVDLRDVGDVVARAMTDPAFPSGSYGLVGPASISGVQAAQVWSEALDRPVRYVGDGPDWPDLLARRLHGAKLDDYRRTLRFLARHAVPTSPRDVAATAALLGRPPLAYATYVRDTAARWGALRS